MHETERKARTHQMPEKDQKTALLAKIFLILALAIFVLSNLFAIFLYFAFFSETQSYTPETIMDPIGSLAFLGTMLTQVVGCTLTAGIGNLLSIIFTSFSISFSSQAARVCRHPPRLIKPFSIILLIFSIIALLLTLPTYFMLSFFLGV